MAASDKQRDEMKRFFYDLDGAFDGDGVLTLKEFTTWLLGATRHLKDPRFQEVMAAMSKMAEPTIKMKTLALKRQKSQARVARRLSGETGSEESFASPGGGRDSHQRGASGLEVLPVAAVHNQGSEAGGGGCRALGADSFVSSSACSKLLQAALEPLQAALEPLQEQLADVAAQQSCLATQQSCLSEIATAESSAERRQKRKDLSELLAQQSLISWRRGSRTTFTNGGGAEASKEPDDMPGGGGGGVPPSKVKVNWGVRGDAEDHIQDGDHCASKDGPGRERSRHAAPSAPQMASDVLNA